MSTSVSSEQPSRLRMSWHRSQGTSIPSTRVILDRLNGILDDTFGSAWVSIHPSSN